MLCRQQVDLTTVASDSMGLFVKIKGGAWDHHSFIHHSTTIAHEKPSDMTQAEMFTDEVILHVFFTVKITSGF